ncbi:MAG: DMT family transporter [Methanobacteriota archaeon]|nr:MAG: DMT family transporter [Euryarchaeota archaeon]
MELLWLPFSIATIFFYGVGQVLAKESRARISSANYLLLFGASVFAIYGLFWLVFREPAEHDGYSWLKACIAAALAGGAYMSYFEAIKHGKISIVGTIVGAYAPWTVILALVFLGEAMSIGEGVGVALVVMGMLVFTYRSNNGGNGRPEKLGILFALGAFFLWGTSAAMSKDVMTDIGQTDFIGVFAVVCPTMWVIYWCATARGKLNVPSEGLKVLALSIIMLTLGGITMYLAFANGPVSIASPITNLYPMLTIAVAKVRLREQLTIRQYGALAMLFAAVPMFSL